MRRSFYRTKKRTEKSAGSEGEECARVELKNLDRRNQGKRKLGFLKEKREIMTKGGEHWSSEGDFCKRKEKRSLWQGGGVKERKEFRKKTKKKKSRRAGKKEHCIHVRRT